MTRAAAIARVRAEIARLEALAAAEPAAPVRKALETAARAARQALARLGG